MTNDKQPSSSAKNNGQDEVSADIWLLEDVYPTPGILLQPTRVPTAENENVVIVLDTNALLVPLSLSKQKLPEIEAAYGKLLSKNRLFVPARAIREFVKNRDTKLADLAKGLSDNASKASVGQVTIPPLLEGLDQTDTVSKAAEVLSEARRKYLAAVQELVDQIRSWRGDDPVTAAYQRLFSDQVIVDIDTERPEIEKEWEKRLKRKIPPGYKDASKPDTGIGDYLIWLAILKIGRDQKRDLIFVTGEEKADWFIRAGGQRVYPRLELVDEYRRASEGKNLHLATLAEILAEMEVATEVVQDVRHAEFVANTAIQVASSHRRVPADGFVIFEYSTHNGECVIGEGEGSIRVKFQKASDISIRVLTCKGTNAVARVRAASTGQRLTFKEFDSTSDQYTIQDGEVFLVQSDAGYVLAGRIHAISDDTRGAPKDEVAFSYRVFAPGEQIEAP